MAPEIRKMTMFQDGNEFIVKIQRAYFRVLGKNYIIVNDVLFVVISKTRINHITVTQEMARPPIRPF